MLVMLPEVAFPGFELEAEAGPCKMTTSESLRSSKSDEDGGATVAHGEKASSACNVRAPGVQPK